MFLRKEKTTIIRSNGRPLTRQFCIFSCDTCNTELRRKAKFLKQKHHFCDKKCMISSQKKGGIIHQEFEKSCLQKFGVKNPFASTDIKEKIKKTNNEKFGCDYPAQSLEIRNKQIETNIKTYGVSSILALKNIHDLGIEAAQSIQAKNKRNASLREIFDDETKKNQIINDRIKTFHNKTGFDFPMQSPDVREKSKRTFMKNYGVEFALQNSNFLKQALQNSPKKFVVNHWRSHEQLICVSTYELAFVNWCNYYKIDFDWQIKFKTPLQSIKHNSLYYIVDAFVKTGILANTWIEIKGFWRNETSKQKWNWFHETYPNSKLLMLEQLNELGIMCRGKPKYV